MKKIQQILVISWASLSLISLGQPVKAQTEPSCFMTEPSGKVIDLSALCDTRQIKSSPAASSASPTNEDRQQLQPINNLARTNLNSEPSQISDRSANTVYFIGAGKVPFTLGASSRSYYVGATTKGNSAYIRRYSKQPTFRPRAGIRSSFAELIEDSNSTSIIRNRQIPFLIYRYPQNF